jgi:hypothetical protein
MARRTLDGFLAPASRKRRRQPQLDRFPTASETQADLGMVWAHPSTSIRSAASPKVWHANTCFKNIHGACHGICVVLLHEYPIIT